MYTRALIAIVALGLGMAACGDKVTVNPSSKGKAGESCTKRDDCEDKLSCIDGRCASAQALTAEDGGGPAPTGGRPGESCARRGDCQTGLICMDQVCVEDSDTLHNDAGISAQRGDRGETCTARNDCQDGLACVANRCRDNNYDFSVQAKQCFTVDCATDMDCCKNQVFPSICSSYKASCDAALPADKAIACANYNASCVCRSTCQESRCTSVTRCSVNTDCFGAGVCFDSKCVQCNTKGDCASPTAECVDHVCKNACTRNEECPIFFNCAAGKCTFAGCATDRECYFSTKDPRAKCEDKECVIPCVADGECANQFEICENGKCLDVGCENDAECRVRLNLNNQPSTSAKTAVCKAPAPKM